MNNNVTLADQMKQKKYKSNLTSLMIKKKNKDFKQTTEKYKILSL